MKKFQFILVAVIFGYTFNANAAIHNVTTANIQSTINSAGTSSGDTINITEIINSTAAISVGKDLTFCSMGTKYRIDAHLADRVFSISSNHNVTIKNLILTGGNQIIGGAISCQGGCNLTLIDCTFENNTATEPNLACGGAINMNSPAILTATNCIFRNNTVTATNTPAGGLGGAVLINGGTFTAIGCTFEDNNASGNGGAVNMGGNTTNTCTFTAENCTFTGNTASPSGGAVYNSGSATFTAENCTFTGNTAPSGGAVANSGGTFTAENCTFTGNSGSYGAVYNGSTGTFTAENCTFTGNTGSYGGAVCSYNYTYLYHCTIVKNTGSGVYITASANRFYSYNCIYVGNDVGGSVTAANQVHILSGTLGSGPITDNNLVDNSDAGTPTITLNTIYGTLTPALTGSGIAQYFVPKTSAYWLVKNATPLDYTSLMLPALATDQAGATRTPDVSTGKVSFGSVELNTVTTPTTGPKPDLFIGGVVIIGKDSKVTFGGK